ncbi:MAG: YhcH/YjgK/YiaL family protein [Desulfotalea sp.]
MIIDIIENGSQYETINRGFSKAFEFLSRSDLKDLAVETHEIDGENVFAIVAKEAGNKVEDSVLETHEKYIDIQVVLAGVDNMGWRAKSSCSTPSTDYDSKEDVQVYKDEPETFVPIGAGSFAIFFPEDAHMPMISDGELHKIIIKVAVDQE